MKTAIVVLPGENEKEIREKITAAQEVGISAEIWWFGADTIIAEKLPAEKVLCLTAPKKAVADCYLPPVIRLVKERKPDIVFLSGGILARDLSAALSAATGGSCALGVTGITKDPRGIIITRFVQGMQLEASFLHTGYPCFFSVVKESFIPARPLDSGRAELSVMDYSFEEPNWFEDYEETIFEENGGLEKYDVIFAGGRGLGSKDAALQLLELGRLMGAGIGATRPAALNTWLPLNRIIGLSGYTLKPKLCIAFGISGCTPFIRGIDKTGYVISVNVDPDAAIFRYSDLGFIADCNEAIRYLLKRVKEK